MTGLHAVPDNPETAEAIKQRDQARGIAAALEAENAQQQGVLAAVAELHRPFDESLWCYECGDEFPCCTARLVVAALSPDGEQQ